MTTMPNRESYIPVRRSDVIKLCLKEGKLNSEDAVAFRKFCEVLSAFTHFRYHRKLEALKDVFAKTNPDSDTVELEEAASVKEAVGIGPQMTEILEGANYNPISKEALQRAFEEESIIDLKTKVDFDDFEEMVAYQRGTTVKTVTKKKFFKKKTSEIETYERVVLLIRFKDEAHFLAKKEKLDQLQFTPGKSYIYFYKSIPRFDLELLFPNVKVSMTLKDKLFFGIPALGASVPIILKTLPQILIIVGAVLFFTRGPEAAEAIGAKETDIRNLMPVLVALLTMVIGFGGLAFKQYSTYKTKRMKFLKNVTDTLFFRNLASNRSVLSVLVDDAEEEDCKEMILAYYHLLTSSAPMDAPTLDGSIETWLQEKLGVAVDFDIMDPIEDLSGLQFEGNTILSEKEGNLEVATIESACRILDGLWDTAYNFE